ncbi:MAG: hypothetical protein AAGI22_13405 [Planctomycetota bacterium]
MSRATPLFLVASASAVCGCGASPRTELVDPLDVAPPPTPPLLRPDEISARFEAVATDLAEGSALRIVALSDDAIEVLGVLPDDPLESDRVALWILQHALTSDQTRGRRAEYTGADGETYGVWVEREDVPPSLASHAEPLGLTVYDRSALPTPTGAIPPAAWLPGPALQVDIRRAGGPASAVCVRFYDAPGTPSGSFGSASMCYSFDRAYGRTVVRTSLERLGLVASVSDLEAHRIAETELRRHADGSPYEAFLAAFAADPTNATLAYGVACGLARRRGADEEVLDWLERAVELGYRDCAVAHWDRDLRHLRTYARFEELFPSNDPHAPARVGWAFGGPSGAVLAAPPTGGWIAYAPEDGGVAIVRMESGDVHGRLAEDRAPVVAMAAGPHGRRLATLDADGRLALWNVVHGKLIGESDAATSLRSKEPPQLAYAAGGDRVVARVGGTLGVWSSDASCLAMREVDGGLHRAHEESDLLASAIDDEVLLRDVRTGGDVVGRMRFDHRVTALRFSQEGDVLAVGTELAQVHVIGLGSRTIRWSAQIPDALTSTGRNALGDPSSVSTIRFDRESGRLAACTSPSYCVGVFETSSGDLAWRSRHLGGRMGAPMPLAFRAGLLVADGGRDVWRGPEWKRVDGWPEDPGLEVIALDGAFLVRRTSGFATVDPLTLERKVYADALPARPNRHPSGWFGGGLPSAPSPGDAGRYDPKRLRAARAGVPLHRPPGD